MAIGVYGQKGVLHSNNIPGARGAAANWMDNSGNMWIFGGHGYGESGTYGNPLIVHHV
jgi:hypothetical protein